jgi:guanylate kinase
LARATETEKSYNTRVAKAEREMEFEKFADYVLINDQLKQTLPEAIQMTDNFLFKEV